MMRVVTNLDVQLDDWRGWHELGTRLSLSAGVHAPSAFSALLSSTMGTCAGSAAMQVPRPIGGTCRLVERQRLPMHPAWTRLGEADGQAGVWDFAARVGEAAAH
jgi:hypothetical protein